MAGNIVIKFTGDASGLAAFYAGVAGQTDALVKRLQKSYSGQFKDALGLTTQKIPALDFSGNPIIKNGRQQFAQVGSAVNGLKVEMDQLNNVMRVTGETGFKLANGTFLPVGSIDLIRGNVTEMNRLNAEFAELRAQADALQTSHGGALRAAQTTAKNTEGSIVGPAAAAKRAADQAKADAKFARDNLTTTIANRRKGLGPDGTQIVDVSKLNGAARASYDAKTNALIEQRIIAQRELEAATRTATKAQRDFDAASNDPRIAAAQAEVKRLRQEYAALGHELGQRIGGNIQAQRANLANPNVDAPAGYQELQRLNATKLISQLHTAGLKETSQEMYKQEAVFNRAVTDLETGITRVGGSFKNTEGVEQSWTAQLDRNGNTITKFTGHMSGLNKILDQTVRNFQKVIEWTVATTVVFGGLAAAGQALNVIKDLDANLTRLSVTANLTKTQTNGLYKQLLQVANVTATPLEELVKASDDLALAVRKPGEAAQDLTKDIATLAETVGIYTNLTGQDTVAATDELVAIMKQLGLTATGVYGILNKITAAAGGQSSTISDIAKALSVMAEAGKQANLTVDSMIGVIKTLSQVTSKSPAEVATSFKNLVGALSNPAAIKALKAYNIGLISEGNSIIDIYTQIAEKIRTGAIKPNDINGLLRAISGGPRRAPDAAALLANINTVLKETVVSQNASNEAFLANAQIVDTIQAKFVRLENVLKDAAFTKFGQLFRDAADSALTAVTSLVEIFSKIPTQALAVIAAFGILVATISLVRKGIQATGITASGVFGTYSKYLEAAIAGEYALEQAIEKTNIALGEKGALSKGLSATGGAIGGIFSSKTGQSAIKGGLLGGLVGAGLAAGTGGGINQIAGTGLQGVGLGLVGIPSPYFITQIAGGIALLAGTFLSLNSATKDNTQTDKENAQAILASYDAAKQAAGTLVAVTKDQRTVTDSIAGLEKSIGSSKNKIDDQAQLNDLYKQFGQNVVDASKAQKDLNAATDEFIKTLSNLPNASQLGAQLKGALLSGSGANPAEIDKIITEAQTRLLQQTLPEIQGAALGVRNLQISPTLAPQGPGGYVGSQENKDLHIAQNTALTRVPSNGDTSAAGRTLDLAPLATITDANEITRNLEHLFTTGTDGAVKFDAQLDVTRLSIDEINTLISKAPEAQRAGLQAAFDVYLQGKDTVTDTANALKYFESVAQGLRGLGFNEAAQQIEQLNTAISALDPTKDAALIQKLVDVQSRIGQSRKPISGEELNQYAAPLAQALHLTDGVAEGSKKWHAIVNSVAEAYLGIPAVLQNIDGQTITISDDTLKLASSMQDAIKGVLSNISSKSSEAFTQLLSKDITPKKYAAITAELGRMAGAAKKVGAAFQDAVNNGGDQFASTLDQALTTLAPKLEKIPGLQDAASLSASELIARLFSLADTYNLNSGAIDNLGTHLSNLFKALSRLSNTPYKIYIGADLSPLRAALIKMRAALANIPSNYTGGPTGLSVAYGQDNALARAISDLGTVSGFFGSGSGSAANIYQTGAGTGAGQTFKKTKTPKTKTGPGLDVSTLDLPDEIANAGNRSSLITEAIRRARALQSKIPGETKEAKNDVVELLKGTQRILEVRGVKEDYLRKALEELAAVEQKRLDFETKADTIRRIRVGNGSFAAIANVPVNSKTGVSLGGATGPINVTLNLNGTVLTPAQFSQFADLIGASIKRQLAQ